MTRDGGVHWEYGHQWGQRQSELMGCVEGSRACRGTGQSVWTPSHRQLCFACMGTQFHCQEGCSHILPAQGSMVAERWHLWLVVQAGSVGYPRIDYVVAISIALQIHNSLQFIGVTALPAEVKCRNYLLYLLPLIIVLNISSKYISVFFVSNIIWKIQKEILNLSIFFLFPVFFLLLEVPSVLLLVVVILFLQEWITPLIMMASYFMLFYLKIFFSHTTCLVGSLFPDEVLNLAVRVWSLYHCITRELPLPLLFPFYVENFLQPFVLIANSLCFI